MLFLAYEAKPRESNEKTSGHGGAFVNCWITGTDKEKADFQARKEIYRAGWIAEGLTEIKIVDETTFDGNEKSLEYYNQAKLDGECYVYHTWPIGSEDED
jgi:hypothetical protein